ncbi:hypothetical protein MJI37_21625, partial [Salmonella enterica subsp. enterica serovar Cerro]|nr:hypothetical protein [Salmonella enterica subsp. enterica serovar Cerro]
HIVGPLLRLFGELFADSQLTDRPMARGMVQTPTDKIGTPLRLYSGYSDSKQDNPLLYFCQHRWRVTPHGELQQLE